MRNLVVFLWLYFFTCGNMFADNFKVISFVENHTDLSARKSPRFCADGCECALIKIQFIYEGLLVEGRLVGDIQNKISEYWVYIDPRTEHIILKHKNVDFKVIVFSDHLKSRFLESKQTYILKVDIERLDNKEKYSEDHDGVIGGHKYVDLGLSVCWATCNIGASAPYEGGNTFAWGEITPKTQFSFEKYKFYRGINSFELEEYSKYSSDEEELESCDDAACAQWKNGWRIPRKKEIEELFLKCSFVLCKYKGVEGYNVTGPSGKSIFLPLVEFNQIHDFNQIFLFDFFDNGHAYADSSMKCTGLWSSSIVIRDAVPQGVGLFYNQTGSTIDTERLWEGLKIRPVIKKTK